MARGDSYLKKRGDIYWFRFQYPPALQETACDLYGVASWPKERARSLGVTTLVEAEAKAAPLIAEHKELLLYHSARNDDANHWADMSYVWLKEPNSPADVLPDGTRIFANEQSIITITPDNNMTTKPNRRRPVLDYTEFAATTPQFREAFEARQKVQKTAHRDIDVEVIEAYIADRRRRDKFQDDDDPNGIRRTLADFKSINGGKTISQSSAKDVDQLIEFLMNDRDPQLSHGRTKKLLSYMRAAVNHDIRTNRAAPNFQFNVFDDFFVPTEEDNPIPPYSEEDIAAIKANLGRFNDEQKLMLVWHISASVRPIGIYSIVSDEWEDGENADTSEKFRTRHVRIVKDKGKYGPRNLPIPQAILELTRDDGTPLLPGKITGPMFTTELAQLLVEINHKLETIKVNENRKTLYSGRHRARDRLLNRDAPDKMSKAIMGHARKIEQHDKYGTGYAMWKMKPWIDKIGF